MSRRRVLFASGSASVAPGPTIPYVAGQRTSSATRSLADAGFTPTRRYAPSVDVPAWHVVETTPGAGEQVKRPATVTVLVSTGPPRVPLPQVTGLDADDAADALEDAGFAVTVEEQADTTVEPGIVLRSDPAVGSRAARVDRDARGRP